MLAVVVDVLVVVRETSSSRFLGARCRQGCHNSSAGDTPGGHNTGRGDTRSRIPTDQMRDMPSQTVYMQRGHKHTRTGSLSESGFGSLRGAPLNISRCLGGESTPCPDLLTPIVV